MPDYLFRRNTVLEAVRSRRRPLYRLWLQEKSDPKLLQPILQAARAQKLPVESASKQRLTQLAGDSSHQGVVLEAGPYPYSDLAAILAQAHSLKERPFILMLDLLHGPQNIGSLLRTAEICGVHGVIIQDRRAPEITPHVAVYSAGATEHLHIAQVTNLVETIRQLQQQDVWVVGMDVDEQAQPLGAVDLNIPLAIVVGHEGQGLRRLVRERCDILLRLPMRGQLESLNAAVAGSILIFQAWQSRPESRG
jgi:23S rRNA (guanosine2251-2'-O)-methyltransferase